MIQEYVEKKYGFKVHTAYIAEVKRSLGLTTYDAPNATEKLKQPRSCDIATANGLPCAFEEYEIFQNGEWKTVTNEIPTNKDRIRFLPFPKVRNREEYTV